MEKLKRLAILLLGIGILAFPAWADPAVSLEFEAGSGSRQIGLSVGNPEGPDIGPSSVLAVTDGFLALDQLNNRILKGNEKGELEVLASLPQGYFQDLAIIPGVGGYVFEEESRTMYRIASRTAQKAFIISPQAEGPRQFNSMAFVGKSLVVGDFATRKLYFLEENGKIAQTASWPLALAITPAPGNQVAFLADIGEDAFNALVFVDEKGIPQKTLKLDGPEVQEYLGSARLLGFLDNGDAIAFGWKNTDPEQNLLFRINKEGKAIPIEPVKGPPVFGVRYGSVRNNILWLNVTPIGGSKIRLQKFNLRKE